METLVLCVCVFEVGVRTPADGDMLVALVAAHGDADVIPFFLPSFLFKRRKGKERKGIRCTKCRVSVYKDSKCRSSG